METNNDIRETLRRAFGNGGNDALIDTLASSIQRSISYDRELSAADRGTILAGLPSCAASLQYAPTMAALRDHVRKAKAATERERERARTSAQEDTVSWGFLLRCWDAFSLHGDVCSIRILTISFLARWLARKKEYVQPDELDWCARKAVDDADAGGLTGKERESFMENAYHEAVVLLMMHKLRRSMGKRPERTAALLDRKRKEYENYSREQFGYPPDWTVDEYNRQRYTTAFKKRPNGRQ